MDSTQTVCQVGAHCFHSHKCFSLGEQDNKGNLMDPGTPETTRPGMNPGAVASSLCVAGGEPVFLDSGYAEPRAAAPRVMAGPLAVVASVFVSASLCGLWTQPGVCPDLPWPPDIALTGGCCLLPLSSSDLMLVPLRSC